MKGIRRSIDGLVAEQVHKWEIEHRKEKEEVKGPVVAVSRLPGCGARAIVQLLAEELRFDIFNEKIIEQVAENAHLTTRIVKTLDEKDVSVVEDWFMSMVRSHYLWHEDFLKHLTHVIMTIYKQGRAIIYGRGASFILPPEDSLRILLVAPLEVRIKNVAKEFTVSRDEAKRHVMRVESERNAYIRRYFHAEFTDPVHYDLVINTMGLSVEAVVNAIKTAWYAKRALGAGR